MERRQLNFDAPILSARRRYSPPSNPTDLVRQKVVKSPFPSEQQSHAWKNPEWEDEKVAKPGAVPFLWEVSPGRPKGEVELLGHRSGLSRYALEERFDDHNALWAQTEPYALHDHDLLLEKLKRSLSWKDESCSDGVETLSQTESAVLNGFSSSVNSSGTFSVDEQTKDLIMRRFLPAAKAVALETPKHVVRKSHVPDEQPKQVREVPEEPTPLRENYRSSPYPHYSKFIEHMESQGTVQQCVVPLKKPWKAWGSIPQLIAKNSLSLFKPHLGSKPKSPTLPRTSEAKTFTRKAKSGPLDMHAFPKFLKKKFHSGMLPRELRGVEDKLTKGSGQFLNNRDRIHSRLSPLRRYRSGSMSPHRNESPKYPLRDYQSANVSPCRNEPPKSPLRRNEPPKSPLRDCQSANVSLYRNVPIKSPLMDYRSANASPCLIEPPRSPLPPKSTIRHYGYGSLSPFRNEADFDRMFCILSEEAESQNVDKIMQTQELCKPLQDVWRNQMRERGLSSSLGDAKEKTLYVDTINLPIPKSYRESGLLLDISGEKPKLSAGIRQMKETNDVRYDSSPYTSYLEEEETLSPTFGSTNKILSSALTCAPKAAYVTDSMEDINFNQSLDQSFGTMKCISEVKQVGRRESDLKSYNRGESDYLMKPHIPPPLPKMPSQSWLWRTSHAAGAGNGSPCSRRTIFPKHGQKARD